MTRSPYSPLLPMACALLAAACDAQATPEYVGESLLTVRGKVIITDDRTEGPLVPALAFVDYKTGQLDIIDVEAHGEFPSNFTLYVYDRPPERALEWGYSFEDSPRFTFGNITAVTADHPPFFRFALSEETRYEGCDAGACYQHFKACTPDGALCEEERRKCDLDYQNCVAVETSGAPELAGDPYRNFAGLSSNYEVLYLEGPAEAGSPLSNYVAGGAYLDAGYHLVSVRPTTEEEEAEGLACVSQVLEQLYADYNQEHGTNLASPVNGTCAAPPCEEPPTEIFDMLINEAYEQGLGMGCTTGYIVEPVEDPEHTPITIEIAANLVSQ